VLLADVLLWDHLLIVVVDLIVARVRLAVPINAKPCAFRDNSSNSMVMVVAVVLIRRRNIYYYECNTGSNQEGSFCSGIMPCISVCLVCHLFLQRLQHLLEGQSMYVYYCTSHYSMRRDHGDNGWRRTNPDFQFWILATNAVIGSVSSDLSHRFKHQCAVAITM